MVRHPCDSRDLELGPPLGQPLGALLPGADLSPPPRCTSPTSAAATSSSRRARRRPARTTTCSRAARAYAPAAVHEARHPQFALGLVLAGTAVALVPRTDDAPGVVWRPLVGGPLAWRTSCAWRRARDPEHARAIADFTAVATAVLRREMAWLRWTPPRPPGRPPPVLGIPGMSEANRGVGGRPHRNHV